jgi:hypothetical protein
MGPFGFLGASGVRIERKFRYEPSFLPNVLLEVALDGALGAGLGVVRVDPELAPGPALAEQVPAPVQLDLELTEPLPVGLLEPIGAVPAQQLVLLLDELVDALQGVAVFHGWRLPGCALT